jgi:hypothetical protein
MSAFRAPRTAVTIGSSFLIRHSASGIMNYVFPGLWPFIEGVARGRDLHHLGRARELWHCKQIQDSLGQLPRLDLQSQRQLLAHIVAVRNSLALAIEGIDAAIAEVTAELGLVSKPDTVPIKKRRA